MDEVNEGTLTTGYKLHYEQGKIDVVTGSEYEEYIASGATLTQGLVGWWKMDEASWGSVIDSSGSGNNGTALNGATVTAGKFGNGGIFDGTNDYINITNSSGRNYFPLTLSAWVKLTQTTSEHPIINKNTSSSSNGFQLLFDNGNVTAWYFKDAANYILSPANFKITGLSDGLWHHVVFTVDNNGGNLYSDGILRSSLAWNGIAGITNTNNDIQIGYYPGVGRYYNGGIDEARIYNRALSEVEVQALYNYAPGPVAHWKFDEGSGVITSDSSGNGYIGTLINTPSWTTGKYNSALGFTASSNSYLNTGSTINLANKSFTVQAWIKESASQNNYILTQTAGVSNNNVLILYMGYNDNINCAFYNNDLASSLTFPYDTNWHHVACTFDATNRARSIYFDGILAGSDIASANYQGSGTLKIAGSYTTNNNAFEGVIDDVRIHNYARTQEQIIKDMNNL